MYKAELRIHNESVLAHQPLKVVCQELPFDTPNLESFLVYCEHVWRSYFGFDLEVIDQQSPDAND